MGIKGSMVLIEYYFRFSDVQEMKYICKKEEENEKTSEKKGGVSKKDIYIYKKHLKILGCYENISIFVKK
jgi:hypothetical protein